MANMAEIKEIFTISYFASLSSILGALLVLFISRPSLQPWLYGVLKSFLAGTLMVVSLSDAVDTGANITDSWAFGLGGAITAGFVAVLTIDPPSGPNKMHPGDATLTKDELRELQKREFDSPRARKRALTGGILTAVVIGLRNLADGVWTFSFVNWGRGVLYFVGFLRHSALQFVTLGAAVAVPMYFGTKCWRRTLLAVAISSAAFPLGHYVAAFALPSDEVVLKLLEFPAGMMSVMTLHWMFASSLENAPWRHCMVASFVGIACLAVIKFQTYIFRMQ